MTRILRAPDRAIPPHQTTTPGCFYSDWTTRNLTTRQQALDGSIGLGVFAVLIATSAWLALHSHNDAGDFETQVDAPIGVQESIPPPARIEQLTWTALSGLRSVLLLAISNQEHSRITLRFIQATNSYIQH